jgi:hypothetical protein
MDVCASNEMSDWLWPINGADVGPAFASSFIPAGVATDRLGVESLLSVEFVRSILTFLRLFFGVLYCDWLFCALDLLDIVGDEMLCCVGVFGRSCDDPVLGRFEGTASVPSSSERGRFSGTLVVVTAVGVGFATGVDTGVVLSDLRAAILGIGFFFLGGSSSSVLVCELLGVLLSGSGRSFFSTFFFLGGSRSNCAKVDVFALENFNLTTSLGVLFSAGLDASMLGDLPLTETDRMRGSDFGGSSGF